MQGYFSRCLLCLLLTSGVSLIIKNYWLAAGASGARKKLLSAGRPLKIKDKRVPLRPIARGII